MLFAVDIGNSNVVAGLFKRRRLQHSWRLETRRAWTAGTLAAALTRLLKKEKVAPSQIGAVVVSCVVPGLVAPFKAACLRLFKKRPLSVSHRLDLGITLKVDRPSQVGADRLVNAAAAWHQEKKALMVLDMGTAITVDVVSARGEYLGGAIAPGVSLAAEALTRRAAKIPRVRLNKPARAIGKNTGDSVRSGIYHGTVGQVTQMLKSCAKELGGRPVVLATGGWSSWVPLAAMGVRRVDPDLTLKGLLFLYERNQKPGKRRLAP